MLLSIASAAISLVIVFLVVSLLCTTAQEFVAGLFSMRAKTLEATLEKMLDDEERTSLVDQFYAHPLIKSLAPSGRLPSYIPKDQFAMAIHDMLTRNRALQVGNVLPVFRILMKEAGGDEVAFKKSVETWFEASMERAGGWYKRQTQRIILPRRGVRKSGSAFSFASSTSGRPARSLKRRKSRPANARSRRSGRRLP